MEVGGNGVEWEGGRGEGNVILFLSNVLEAKNKKRESHF